MKRFLFTLAVALLSACTTVVRDRDCERSADILGDASYYRVCMIQKAGK